MVNRRKKDSDLEALKCRACLGNDGIVDLSEKVGAELKDTGMETLKDVFEVCTGFSVEADEPQALCNNCMQSLLSCQKFLSLSRKTQDLLKGVEVKIEIDEIKFEDSCSPLAFLNDSNEVERDSASDSEKTYSRKLRNPPRFFADPEDLPPAKTFDPTGLTCPICKKRKNYSSHRLLTRHITRSHPNLVEKYSNIPCQYCGKTFLVAAMKDKHEGTCAKGPRLAASAKNQEEICPTCGKMVKRKDMKAHIKRFHTVEVLTEPLVCDLCEKKFKNRAIIMNHMKVVHLRIEKQTKVCDVCSATFKSADKLDAHMRRDHQTGPAFNCDLCEYSTFLLRNLTRHKRRHLNIRKHRCDICGFRVDGADKLKEHIASHSDERKHICPTCGAAYKTRTSYFVHALTHKGITYTCPVCNTEFKNRRAHRDHIKVKHPEIPVPRYGNANRNRGTGLKLMVTKPFGGRESTETQKPPETGIPDQDLSSQRMNAIAKKEF